MAERISDIKNRIDYLYGVSDRCNKIRLPLSLISLLGISGTAVSASLFSTPYAGETLVIITAACATTSIISVGALALASRLSRDADDEIFELENKYSVDLEKNAFMERISGYTR